MSILLKTLNHLYSNFFMEFLKDPSLDLYSSSYTLFSFSALDFSHNITHIENTITNVANWMSSNFLSLNPSKPEFLIFGLLQQLSKLNNPIPFIYLTMSYSQLLVSSVLKICYLRNISLIFLNHASSIFVT